MSKYYDDGTCRYLYDEGGFYTVDKCPRPKTEITVLGSINDIPVKRINNFTFNCKTVTNYILISPGIEEIGNYAFNSCVSLEQIIIPNTVQKIGKNAFSSCSALKTIVVPPSVSEIGDCAFEDSPALKYIYVQRDSPAHKWFSENLPVCASKLVMYDAEKDSEAQFDTPIYEFDYMNFSDEIYIMKYTGCRSNVRIPSQINGMPVISVESDAFRGCLALKSVYIPSTVTNISVDTFGWCPNLENIFVSQSNPHYTCADGVLMSKDEETLIRCPEGKSYGIYVIPTQVVTLGRGAFSGCRSIGGFGMPKVLVSIGAECFAGCAELRTLVLPPRVSKIGEGAFRDCANLTSVTISPHLTNFGEGVFERCDRLTDVFVVPGTSSVAAVKLIPDIAGKMKTAPASYYTECMPYITQGINISEVDMGQVSEMLKAAMSQDGSIDISKIPGVPEEFADKINEMLSDMLSGGIISAGADKTRGSIDDEEDIDGDSDDNDDDDNNDDDNNDNDDNDDDDDDDDNDDDDDLFSFDIDAESTKPFEQPNSIFSSIMRELERKEENRTKEDSDGDNENANESGGDETDEDKDDGAPKEAGDAGKPDKKPASEAKKSMPSLSEFEDMFYELYPDKRSKKTPHSGKRRSKVPPMMSDAEFAAFLLKYDKLIDAIDAIKAKSEKNGEKNNEKIDTEEVDVRALSSESPIAQDADEN